MKIILYCALLLVLALSLPVQGLTINVKYPDGKVRAPADFSRSSSSISVVPPFLTFRPNLTSVSR